MDRKIKLLAVSSVLAVMASGCATYNPQTGTYDNSYGFGTGTSQNNQVAQNTCGQCSTNTTTTTKPVAYKGRTQQWYIDRWNRQQQQQGKVVVQQKPKTYTGYSGAKKTATNYYDYSGGASNTATNKQIYTGTATNNTASNKSIYTGNYSNNTYQPYTPKTYTTGANASSTYVDAGGNSGSYSGSHGGGAVATGTYKTGDANYTVQKGDTVFSVMRLTGVYWKTIISLNGLQAPYTISPGQNLRLK